MTAQEKYRRAYQNARCGAPAFFYHDVDPAIINAFTSYAMKMDTRFRGWTNKKSQRTWNYHKECELRRKTEAFFDDIRKERQLIA